MMPETPLIPGKQEQLLQGCTLNAHDKKKKRGGEGKKKNQGEFWHSPHCPGKLKTHAPSSLPSSCSRCRQGTTPSTKINWKVGEGGIERHLPAACTKYAKYKSSSLTETPIWWGCTHSPGLEHCGDFTRRSPSVLSSGIPLNKITITRSNLQTLSAWRRQSILLILPFWSGLERTQHGGFFPVTVRTKSSRNSGLISFRSFARSLDAHFCFTSGFSLSSSSFTALSSSFDMRFSCFLKYFLFRACRLNHVYANARTWGRSASMKGWNSSWKSYREGMVSLKASTKKPLETGLLHEALGLTRTAKIRKVLMCFMAHGTRTPHQQTPAPPLPLPRFTSYQPRLSAPTAQKQGPTSDKHRGQDGVMTGPFPPSQVS